MHKLTEVRSALYILWAPDISVLDRGFSVQYMTSGMSLVQFLRITGLFGFVSCCSVLVHLKAIPVLVSLNRFVTFLILGLQYVEEGHILFFLFLLVSSRFGFFFALNLQIFYEFLRAVIILCDSSY